MATELQGLAGAFRKLALRLEGFAERDTKSNHLATNITASAIQASRLLHHAIDHGAFPKEQVARANRSA